MVYILRNQFNRQNQQEGPIGYQGLNASSVAAAPPPAGTPPPAQQTYSGAAVNRPGVVNNPSPQGHGWAKGMLANGGEGNMVNDIASTYSGNADRARAWQEQMGPNPQGIVGGNPNQRYAIENPFADTNTVALNRPDQEQVQAGRQAKYTDPNSGINYYAKGGMIREPVQGVGLQSGQQYMLGEQGPEQVTPMSGFNGPAPQTAPADQNDQQQAQELQSILGRNVFVRGKRPIRNTATANPTSPYTQHYQSVNAPVIQVTTDEIRKLGSDPEFAPLVQRLIQAELRGGLSVHNPDGTPYSPQTDFGGSANESPSAQPNPDPVPTQPTQPGAGGTASLDPGLTNPVNSPNPTSYESPVPPIVGGNDTSGGGSYVDPTTGIGGYAPSTTVPPNPADDFVGTWDPNLGQFIGGSSGTNAPAEPTDQPSLNPGDVQSIPGNNTNQFQYEPPVLPISGADYTSAPPVDNSGNVPTLDAGNTDVAPPPASADETDAERAARQAADSNTLVA